MIDFRTVRASVSSIPTTFRTNLQGIDNSSNIAQPIYARQEKSPQNSPNMSPTYSSMTNNARQWQNLEIFVLENTFEINKEWGRKHFYSNKKKAKRKRRLL